VAFDLGRFLDAQEGVYAGVLEELRGGRKDTHWIWFTFPQIAGLGRSWISQQYSIVSLEEARAYLADPALGARLRECAGAVLATKGRTANEIFGELDAIMMRRVRTYGAALKK